MKNKPVELKPCPIDAAIQCLEAAIDDNHTATGRLFNIHTARNLLRLYQNTRAGD